MRYLPLLFVFSLVLPGNSLRADPFADDVESIGVKKTPAPATVTPPPIVATVPVDDQTVASDEPAAPSTRKPGLQSGTQPAPQVVQDRNEVARLEQAGDREAARQYALEALKRNPEDPNLNSYVKLTAPAQTGVDLKTVKSRVAELMSGMRKEEEPGGSILASPISFGAMAGAGSRLPAALVGPAVAAGKGLSLGGEVNFVSPLTREAGTKLRLGDLGGAENLLSRRIAENPSDATALRLRALTRRERKNYDSSAEDARGAMMIMPMDMRALRILVEDLVDLGRREEALKIADQAVKDYPGDAHALAGRATVWESLGRPDLQIADLKVAAAANAEFDSLLSAVQRKAETVPGASRPRSLMIWLGLIGTALLFFSFALLPKLWKSGQSEIRVTDRAAAAADLRSSVPSGYSLGERLGQGGMGVVYEGEDRALKRKVAIKILRPEVAASPRERNRFLKEARTVAKLKHPNIVDIHSVHDENGEVWLVFEHVKGETLHEALGGGKLPVQKAMSLLGQVASALDYAHGQGVVHQDLKPANIMVDGDVAKVMDLGIARCIRETLSTLSKIEVSGTPAYMAPEQELGGAAVGPAADIFAFGACAYECLSGQTPFPAGFVMIKVEKRYQQLSQIAGLPAAVDAVIARALDPEPAKRWPTAAVFVAALAQGLQAPQAVSRAA